MAMANILPLTPTANNQKPARTSISRFVGVPTDSELKEPAALARRRLQAKCPRYKVESLVSSRSLRRRSIILLRRFPLRPRFPPSVDPQILPRIGADEVFNPFRVALRDVAERVVLLLPVLGVGDVLHAHVKVEIGSLSSRVADDDRHFELHRQQADRFVGAGLSSEESDEDSFRAGVLVGDEADGPAAVEQGGEFGGRALFVDDPLALALADAEEPFVH